MTLGKECSKFHSSTGKDLVTAKSRETLVHYVSFVTKVMKEAHFGLKIA